MAYTRPGRTAGRLIVAQLPGRPWRTARSVRARCSASVLSSCLLVARRPKYWQPACRSGVNVWRQQAENVAESL